MSDPAVIASAIVTVIVATGGAIVTVVNAIAAARYRQDQRRNETQARADAQRIVTTTASIDRKADVITEKATEIHQTTNGNLSKLQAQLDVAREEIRGLKTLMATILAAQDDAHKLQDAHAQQLAAALVAPPGGWQRRSTDPKKDDPHGAH